MAKSKRKNAEQSETTELTESYKPSVSEQTAIDEFLQRREGRRPLPKLTVSKNGQLTVDHPDPIVGTKLLMNVMATTSEHFFLGILHHLSSAARIEGKPNVDLVNFMMAVIRSIEPRDEIETMLAAQMAAVHMLSMTLARRLAHTETTTQQDSAERAMNKLMRTFTTQMQTLRRYRNGGEQTVRVEHVTVNEGGQAIVGNVDTGGRRTQKDGATP